MDKLSSYSAAFLDKHRYINVEYHDWWQWTQECFAERMLDECGVVVSALYFSGFCSQGDGACWLGYVANSRAFIERMGGAKDFPLLHEFAHKPGGYIAVSWSHSGAYYHEHTQRVAIDILEEDVLEELYDVELMEDSGVDPAGVLAAINDELDQLERAAIDFGIDKSRQVYRALEDEHDSLTSDEAVIETLIANDILEEDEQ